MTPKDIAIRAAKTAIQAGIAVVIGAQAGFYAVDTWKAAATAAIAAGLSAVGNALHTTEGQPATYDNTLTPSSPPASKS